MPDSSTDDVIRVRIDTQGAIASFVAMLKEQAAAGETDAPANPPNRAVFRELAPYRLVEYEYVDNSVGTVEGAYIGFPDGTVYAVAELIPEEAVDALVVSQPVAPLYVYVVLKVAASLAEIDRYVAALASHIGLPQVAVAAGTARIHWGDAPLDDETRHRIEVASAEALSETTRHFTKERLLRLHAGRSSLPDGRAYAQVTYGFIRHVVEFPSASERDDFVAWTDKLCEMIAATAATWEEFGVDQFFRPAHACNAPPVGARTVVLPVPGAVEGGRPWAAFGGADAATAKNYGGTAVEEGELRRSVAIALEYWRGVTAVLARENAAIRQVQAAKNDV